jgi:hypothetical protein
MTMLKTSGYRLKLSPSLLHILIGLTIGLVSSVPAQVQVSGQATGGYQKAWADDLSQYVVNGGLGTFFSRLDGFADASLSADISFHSAVRIQQDGAFHIDQMFLEVRNITAAGLTLRAGEIDLPMGDMGERRYPMKNPFLHLPFMNEHLTNVRISDNQLWPFDAKATSAGNGVRLLDQGLYDIGMSLSWSCGMLDITGAMMNGSVASSSTYSGSGLRQGTAPGAVARLSITPDPAVTVGVSASRGYLSSGSVSYGYSTTVSGASFQADCIEGDVSFSIEHLTLQAQGLLSRWKFGDRYGTDFDATAYSCEASYAFLPRWSAAVRFGGVASKSISTVVIGPNYTPVAYDGRWDENAVRFEGALGYRFDRGVLFKLVYERTSTISSTPGVVVPLAAVQAVVAF